ncbi:MAG: helix-turn-helix transcriptional regulator [Clostridia bacterium]|nr:helix-turn-helix transcriptional regulator [Clostridia bacterium]
MDYKEISKRIKKARKEQKITQEQLAERMGVSVSFISQAERGKKKFNLEHIHEISYILEKPISYFIEDFSYTHNTEKIDDIILLLKEMDLKKLQLVREFIKILVSTEE